MTKQQVTDTVASMKLHLLPPQQTSAPDQLITALLVHDRARHLYQLRAVLAAQGLFIREVAGCREARDVLQDSFRPHLVFTDTILPDGTWIDVLGVVLESVHPANLILVSRLEQVELYLDALERGAFDFLAPPFTDSHVGNVVRCASRDVLALRKRSNRRLG